MIGKALGRINNDGKHAVDVGYAGQRIFAQYTNFIHSYCLVKVGVT